MQFHSRNPTTSYNTPQDLFDKLDAEFHFELDAAADASNTKCSTYYTIEDNALKQNWGPGPVWVNPPYSGLRPWIEKAYEESLRGVTTVMLLPVRSEVGYWQEIILPIAEVRYQRQITFAGWKMHAPFPCAIVIFRPRISEETRAARGGRVAAARMSAQERRERAQLAARARWGS